jgi:hypothetical protein
MADVKISGLPTSTTPLAGTEVLPIVQGGQTRQVSVANLTAGRAIAATSLTASGLTNGRVPVIGTSGLISDSANLLWDAGGSLLGIGVSPSYRLHVVTASTAVVAGFRASDTTNNARNIIIGNSQGDLVAAATTTGNGLIYSDSGKTLAFGTNGSTTARLTLATGGDVTVDAGNLVIGTSGKGIDFSATGQAGGMTSELLDDYEEGTWTPTLSAEVPGNLSVTYGVRLGTYTKVGRLVTASCRITTSAFTHTTAADDAQIQGLPFQARSLTNMRTVGSLALFGALKAGFTQVNSQVETGSSSASFIATGVAGGSFSSVKITEMTSGGTPFVSLTVVYETDS